MASIAGRLFMVRLKILNAYYSISIFFAEVDEPNCENINK